LEQRRLTNKNSIIYFANRYDSAINDVFGQSEYDLQKFNSIDEIQKKVSRLSVYELNTCLLIEVDLNQSNRAFALMDFLKDNWLTHNLIVIFLLTEESKEITKLAFNARVSDCYNPVIDFEQVLIRLEYLISYKNITEQLKNPARIPLRQYEIPFIKRSLDVLASITALILLSPFFILVAILLKLDSKGPIFYASKRVGTGYKIFDFFKFRSMRIDADKEVEKLKAEANQYGDSAFFKMKDDPRITKFGNFLRRTSIDELPQLYNVLRGDMSLVGNRPLPLYEAEQLTTDEWSTRFLGPAGITGLWQIKKRGKADMSDRERKRLDNFYTQNFSLWLDLKIILLTIPVLFQKEKV
jgi:lipopolysaccharide/colanic/teichoic acid biosynthesis glycosyltransferase